MPSGTESVKKPAGYNDEILSRWDLDECHSGQMKSEDLEGKVHIVSFFFATCPGTCNLQNTHLRAIAQQYGAKGVKFLSITTDPKVDSRAALSKYAGGFSANPDHWYFLRSDDIVYLRRIGAEMYKVGGVKEKGHQVASQEQSRYAEACQHRPLVSRYVTAFDEHKPGNQEHCRQCVQRSVDVR